MLPIKEAVIYRLHHTAPQVQIPFGFIRGIRLRKRRRKEEEKRK